MTRRRATLWTIAALALLAAWVPAPAVAQVGGDQSDLIEVGTIHPPDYYFGLLTDARRRRGKGDAHEAFLLLGQILSEGSEIEPYFQEAEYEIALALFDMGLFQSALSFIERIADGGEQHARYRDTLQWLVRLNRKIPGNQSVLERIASYPPAIYPAALVDELNYLVGRYRYDDLDYDGALDRLRQVRRKAGEEYIRARYLMGIIYVQLEKAREAERTFKDVLRFFATRGDPGGDVKRFKDLATMALARMFFTVGNHTASSRFYQRIPAKAEVWLDALYELSWAYFHMGDYARSMGNLWTLDSPYFEDEYFPEAKLLQATILYATCNDREVIRLVDRFVPEFQRLKKEVTAILERTQDPNEFYFFLARLAATRSDKLSLEVRRLFNAALSSRRMRRYFDFIIQLNEEVQDVQALQRKSQAAKPVVLRMLQDLSAFRELMLGEAGDLARQRLDRVRKDVSTMLADSLRLKFETIRRMRKGIDKASKVDPSSAERQQIETDDEHVLYDFDGEYWRDELGNYLYRVRDLCQR